jgi:glutathione reductase (NADPH)
VRPLKGFDPDLVDQLVAWMRTLGVDIRLDTAVDAIEQRPGHMVVRTRTAKGETGEISADLVVHGAGRVPEIGDLALEQAGVAFDRHTGIVVNAYLQSVSNPAVYAAGDSAASGAWQLTPLAGLEGGVVAQNLLHGNVQTPNYAGTATVVYTTPPLARIGLLESEARAQGLQLRVHRDEMGSWYSSRRQGLTQTGFKVLVEEETGRVVGAHLLAHHAEEVINLFGLAMRTGVPASALRELPVAYPTSSSDVAYMA